MLVMHTVLKLPDWRGLMLGLQMRAFMPGWESKFWCNTMFGQRHFCKASNQVAGPKPQMEWSAQQMGHEFVDITFILSCKKERKKERKTIAGLELNYLEGSTRRNNCHSLCVLTDTGCTGGYHTRVQVNLGDGLHSLLTLCLIIVFCCKSSQGLSSSEEFLLGLASVQP